MRNVAKEWNIEIVDAGSILDRNPSVYVDFAHFNKLGHKKVAYLLYEKITQVWATRYSGASYEQKSVPYTK